MEPGPAFDERMLGRLRGAIEEKVVKSKPRVARAILFCGRPVEGYFHDAADAILPINSVGFRPSPLPRSARESLVCRSHFLTHAQMSSPGKTSSRSALG
jgi:hypothetical protein